MTKEVSLQSSQLFTLRLWCEDLGDGRSEWRGKVQHVASGETHYFRDWPTLIEHLLSILPNLTMEEVVQVTQTAVTAKNETSE